MLYKAERRYKSTVMQICANQETGIGNRTVNWVKERGINWEWSGIYTPTQNGRAERSGGVLTKKARCIRIAANLPEDLSPECYLAAHYLYERTPKKFLA